MGNSTTWGPLFILLFPAALCLVGLLTSGRSIAGIRGACKTIGLWRGKQRELIEANSDTLRAYVIQRESMTDELGKTTDLVHERSLRFATWAPWIFLVLWIWLLLVVVAIIFQTPANIITGKPMMKIQLGILDAGRNEMYSELLESEAPMPIPFIGDVVQINRSGLFRITDRKLIYEGSNLSVYLTGEPFEDSVHEISFPKNQ